MVSYGFRPGCAEANDRWPGGCQSCVSTTCANRVASRLIDGHDLIAARNREAALGTEVVLDIDDQQNILIADREISGHAGTLSCGAKRLSTSSASRTRASAT